MFMDKRRLMPFQGISSLSVSQNESIWKILVFVARKLEFSISSQCSKVGTEQAPDGIADNSRQVGRDFCSAWRAGQKAVMVVSNFVGINVSVA